MACSTINYSEVYFASKLDSEPTFALLDFALVYFDPELDLRFRCPVCNNPLKEPVQITCGHRMCRECFQRIIRNPNPQCPLDKEPLSKNEVFNDVCCKREVLCLICYCLNRKYGCEWKKELMYLEDHIKNCEYREVPCQNEGCEEMIPLKKLDQHMKESCIYKKLSCQHCGKHVPEVQMEAHLFMCEKVPITCQYCGITDIVRELEKDHIENDCEETEKPCKFKDVGCIFKGNLEDLNEHYDAQKDEHLKLTVQSMETAKKEQDKLKERVEKVEKDNENLKKQLAEQRETLAANSQNLSLYQARLNKAEKTVADHKNAIAQIRERTEGNFEDLNKHFDDQKDEHLKLIVQSTEAAKKEQDELKGRVEKVEMEKEKLKNQLDDLESAKKLEKDELKEDIEKLKKQLAEYREKLSLNSQNLISYQVRFEKTEKTVAENAKEQIRERTEDAAALSKPGVPKEVSLRLEEFRSSLADQEEKLRLFERELARGNVAGGGPRSSFSSSSLTLDRLDRNEHQLALHNFHLEVHDLKIQKLEATSYKDEDGRRDHKGSIGKRFEYKNHHTYPPGECPNPCCNRNIERRHLDDRMRNKCSKEEEKEEEEEEEEEEKEEKKKKKKKKKKAKK